MVALPAGTKLQSIQGECGNLVKIMLKIDWLGFCNIYSTTRWMKIQITSPLYCLHRRDSCSILGWYRAEVSVKLSENAGSFRGRLKKIVGWMGVENTLFPFFGFILHFTIHLLEVGKNGPWEIHPFVGPFCPLFPFLRP